MIEAQSEMVLSKVEYCRLKGKRQREEKENEDEEVAVQVSVQEMGKILEQWYVSSTVLPKCNKEHKVAVLICVLSLADSFCSRMCLTFQWWCREVEEQGRQRV